MSLGKFTAQLFLGTELRGACQAKWQLFGTQQLRRQNTAVNAAELSNDLEKARPFDEMPSPSTFKIIRNYLPGGKYYKKDVVDIMLLMQQEYGNAIHFPGIFGKPPMVMCFNPNDFEIVFRNEGVWPGRMLAEVLEYHRTKHRGDFFKGVEGLITTQGEQWAKFRTAVNPTLMQPKNVRLYLHKMSQVNREFIERIRKIRDPETQEMPANFEKVINQWALESVAIVALDKHLGLFKDSEMDPRLKKYFESVNEFVLLSGELEMKPSLWKFLPTSAFKRAMSALDSILEITTFYINEAMQRIEEEKKSGIEKPENEKGVLEKLLKIDTQIAIVMAMDMLMAGVDTTSGTFAGIMLCLAKNPEKQEKLREEIRKILPNKDSEFSESSLQNMSYLRACIKESMRVYPLVVGNVREVQRDVAVSGYRVPKGMYVAMMAKSSHYDEKHFPNPQEFIPERWLRTSRDAESKKCPSSLKSSNPFAFLPFGFGPRSCIGRRIAELELELGVARVIRNFNVSFNHPMEQPFKMMLVNIPNIPLKFQMTDVES